MDNLISLIQKELAENVELKKELSINDVIICDANIIVECGDRKHGYNMGDILNMPYLSGQWEEHNWINSKIYSKDEIYKDTIINLYCKDRIQDKIVPNIPRIIRSVDEFTEKYKSNFINIYNIVQNPNCMCVHVRSGDLELLNGGFISIIINLSKKYKYIILLSGIHSDEHFKKNDQKMQNFLRDINIILNQGSNIYIYLNNADVHLSIMSNASNLLLHRGGFSALGSIVSTGNLFITKQFYHAFSKNWIDKVNKPYTLF
jgi:hypothetical protein